MQKELDESMGDADGPANVVVNEVQLLLAEKRTSLAFLRTGIAVFALPLSVLSALIATSNYYEFLKVLPLLLPVLVLCAGLIVLGVYLVHRSVMRVLRFDRMINEIKRQHSRIRELMD
jgi:uncharacterized membrane protein YidH (DUF202 family)